MDEANSVSVTHICSFASTAYAIKQQEPYYKFGLPWQVTHKDWFHLQQYNTMIYCK